jgi:hypothetical protein
MRYMVTFTINIPQMLAYIPYMDPMGYGFILVDGRHLLFFEEMPINIEYMDSTIPNDGDFQIYF